MRGAILQSIRDTLNSARSTQSLEPNRWAAASGWFRGEHLTSPPAIAKQRHLLNVFRSRRHHILIEAGTYKGETTAFFAQHAEHVYSVELHQELFAAAEKRFAAQSNVTLIHGDSLIEIPKLVANCQGDPPLVFLDGHFSGMGTAEGIEMEPAESTLRKLTDVAPPGTTIVIDDLRLFGSGLAGFPQLDTITAAARTAFPRAVIRTGLDSIVIEVASEG
ncbi:MULTISPECIES: class I SAM-dependent methyltransferase [unclassified Mycobacterium]|uniref:class I SAM-dependent methyltransferase n=1 Tax=unclassified Mycobacterium TaxID=2642494 RepID=UPI0012E8706E|nr:MULTISPECIES: class I SAM-dependent methyltransferase [unclassified Mycobacterium]